MEFREAFSSIVGKSICSVVRFEVVELSAGAGVALSLKALGPAFLDGVAQHCSGVCLDEGIVLMLVIAFLPVAIALGGEFLLVFLRQALEFLTVGCVMGPVLPVQHAVVGLLATTTVTVGALELAFSRLAVGLVVAAVLVGRLEFIGALEALTELDELDDGILSWVKPMEYHLLEPGVWDALVEDVEDLIVA